MIEYVAKASCKGLVKGIAHAYCPKNKDKKEYEKTLLDYVDDLMVEDVVKVVRCKDCMKRWHDGYCPERKEITNDGGFCSWGRRNFE